MARIILNVGKSGSGKSTSLRNFANNEYALINVLGKDLPFKNNKKFLVTEKYVDVKTAIAQYIANGVKTIVLDDAGYLITRGLIEASQAKDSFGHFRKMATDFIDLVQFCNSIIADYDVNIVFNMHEEVTDLNEVKVKTAGKMIDSQFVLEGYFTIVIRTLKTSEGHKFILKSNGLDIVKSPIGMFDEENMDNDLKAFLEKVNNFNLPEEDK